MMLRFFQQSHCTVIKNIRHTCQEQEEAVERLNEDKKRYLDELNLLPNAVSCFGKRNLTMSATEFLLVAADDGEVFIQSILQDATCSVNIIGRALVR
ncbi:hypothetical protein M514_21683 [Trichuris suis]|uniref:Uncharacterized protein n=1 Tax=Trichuris suis TaxID=68888 RepID=A0A085N9M3_9BILA|nr:hypothetical protein M514_21683 [Trichuris suis]